jgi:ClpP class serine protease
LVDSIGGLQETIQAMAKNLDLKEYSIYEEVQAQPINQFVSNYIGIISKLNKMSLEGYLKNELFFKPVLYYPYGL